MIFFGDVSPAVEASLVGLAIAAIVNPAVLLVAQARQFGHERTRWRPCLAQIGRFTSNSRVPARRAPG
jgi:hypothetical protein